MDLRLDGKVAFVTGASKGIGRCVAEFLAREGCNVVITPRPAGPLEAAAEKIAAGTGRAALVTFLASPLASFITAPTYPSAGRSAQRSWTGEGALP